MDSRPPSLLLLLLLHISLLNFWQCARGQSSYTIDNVSLAVLPSSTVQSGTTVTLRCQVSVSHYNISQLMHTFELTKDDILVYSSTTKEDSVAYELSPARAADSGNYECRVKVKDKSRISYSQKLDITGLQTPVLYLNKTKPYENEEFTATCSAPEEKGSLIFSFYQKLRTGESKKIKQPAATGNSSNTTLVMRQIGDSFLYCDYEINLVSGMRRSNRSTEIPVIVKGLYISPVMNVLPSSTVFEGDVIEVVCKVVSELSDIEVFLKKDRRILKQAPVSLSHRFTTQEGDSGELECKAEWGNVQKETYQTITVKELFSKPRLSVQPMEIFEGDHFMLTCSVSVFFPDKIDNDTMKFSIYRNNKLIGAKTYRAVARPSENGNYTCKVEVASLTQYFVKESKTVVVKAKVPVSKPVLSVVGGTLVLGKRFQLLCQSDSGTLPISYNLYGPNKLHESRVVRKPGEQAIFNCSAIYKLSDVNNFLCHARNSVHRRVETETGQMLHSTNIIEPVSRPVLSIPSGMGGISEGQSVTLVCSVQSGTPPIDFAWYHKDKSFLGRNTFKTLKGYHKINNIRGEDQGEYYCESTNPAKEIKRSDNIRITVKMAGWKKALIAATCILLLLSLILVVLFKRRLLPCKRKTAGGLSVKSAGTKVERLSLTQAEVNEAANVTPGMIGKSVWSEHVSGSESDDQNSVASPENPEPEYTEVQTRRVDPNRAPVKKGTDTVYSEVRNSKQGVPEQPDGQGSVEYAQLNHDADHHSNHSNHGNHCVEDDHIDEIDGGVDNNTADHGE